MQATSSREPTARRISERHHAENVRQHDEIFAALESGDPEATRQAMRAHIASSGEHLTAWYERRSQTVLCG